MGKEEPQTPSVDVLIARAVAMLTLAISLLAIGSGIRWMNHFHLPPHLSGMIASYYAPHVGLLVLAWWRREWLGSSVCLVIAAALLSAYGEAGLREHLWCATTPLCMNCGPPLILVVPMLQWTLLAFIAVLLWAIDWWVAAAGAPLPAFGCEPKAPWQDE
jgi:hypothetical protein